MTTTDRVGDLRSTLARSGQEHLLAFIGDGDTREAHRLIEQLEGLDLDHIDRLIDDYVRRNPDPKLPTHLEPAPYYPNDPESNASRGPYDFAKYREVGADLIRGGAVAAFTVAGGQGTRLGWNGPKGTFPATPVTGKSLFQLFAEQIRASERKFGVTIPWYIMTSPINDAATRDFFRDNNNFGLNRRDIFMFPQGVMPSFEKETGRMLLADRFELAVNPDGHGGSIRALSESGALDDMGARGIRHISYFQVDNPLVNVVDPLFLGLHASAPDSSAEMSSKMVPKIDWKEKVGVFCCADGKTCVIEYSDLPDELAQETDADGTLRFVAGSIAIHLLGVRFLESITTGGSFRLPWHRAEKKVPYIDPDSGEEVSPDQPNAVKLEAFVFDAIPLAESSIVCETTREDEFAPIKNADGVDSARTSRHLQSDRAARWLEAHGVSVARGQSGHASAAIEISPLVALTPDDLSGQTLPASIAAGDEFCLLD